MRILTTFAPILAFTAFTAGNTAIAQSVAHPLAGSWQMAAAWEILADGSRVTTYTEQPDGLLLIDHEGRYSLQIFHPQRQQFAGSKAKATLAELKTAVLGSSTHYGTISVDSAKQQLKFNIDAASYPNWNKTTQVRDFKLQGGLLTYAVPATASGNGTKAYSVWRRLE